MVNLAGFNAEEHEPMGDYSPVPAGMYLASLVACEEKVTRAGTGKFLSLSFEIVEGEYAKRRLFSNINTVNPNPQCVAIGKGELSALCRAVGVLTPNDSQELMGIPIAVKVGLETRKDNGETTNRIKAYHPRAKMYDSDNGSAEGKEGNPWA